MLNCKIGFIGGGNMAQAIIGGLLAQGVNVSNIYVSEPNEQTQTILQEKQIQLVPDNVSLVNVADVVILAVKPQVVEMVLTPLVGQLKQQLIISIMAGVEIATIANILKGAKRIVRVMPNTPALVQLGASGVYADPQVVSQEDQQLATHILNATGSVTWVEKEQDLDSVTAVSGSGPAYFFYLMEHMIHAGQMMGLDEATAKQLTLQTALGAAQMAVQSGLSPTQLRQNVTSPNGTTQAAIETFNRENMAHAIKAGMFAAQHRSQQLAQQLRELMA